MKKELQQQHNKQPLPHPPPPNKLEIKKSMPITKDIFISDFKERSAEGGGDEQPIRSAGSDQSAATLSYASHAAQSSEWI